MTPKQIARTAERLQRAAYEFELVAHRLRAAGKDSEANGVADVASRLGKIGRGLRTAEC